MGNILSKPRASALSSNDVLYMVQDGPTDTNVTLGQLKEYMSNPPSTGDGSSNGVSVVDYYPSQHQALPNLTELAKSPSAIWNGSKLTVDLSSNITRSVGNASVAVGWVTLPLELGVQYAFDPKLGKPGLARLVYAPEGVDPMMLLNQYPNTLDQSGLIFGMTRTQYGVYDGALTYAANDEADAVSMTVDSTTRLLVKLQTMLEYYLITGGQAIYDMILAMANDPSTVETYNLIARSKVLVVNLEVDGVPSETNYPYIHEGAFSLHLVFGSGNGLPTEKLTWTPNPLQYTYPPAVVDGTYLRIMEPVSMLGNNYNVGDYAIMHSNLSAAIRIVSNLPKVAGRYRGHLTNEFAYAPTDGRAGDWYTREYRDVNTYEYFMIAYSWSVETNGWLPHSISS